MKYVKYTKQYSYSEIDQINPIRWEICYFNGTSMEVQTGKFKCKDFFNDIVASYHGNKFQIYGFECQNIKLNDEGVYVRVTGLVNYKNFVDNIDRVINTEVDGENCVTFEKYYRKGALLFIPRWFFENTYKISLLTLLIRLCNYEMSFNSIEHAITSLELEAEGTINDSARKYTIKHKFNLPEKYQSYWWFLSPEYNSTKTPSPSSGWIHNNGVQGWSVHAN